MKVMCIESPDVRQNLSGKEIELKCSVVVGETYTVVDEYVHLNKRYYQLEEFPSHQKFAQRLFAPLSNIDERVIHGIKADEIFSELEVSEG